jgi:ribonuclease G
MAKEICISSTPHETRLAILEDDQLAEIYYERENEYTLAGSIYNGRVTRVLPGMQSAFVDLGLERDAFLYVTDFVELEDQEDSDEVERAAATGASRPPREVRPANGQDQAPPRSGDKGDRSDRGDRGGRSESRSEGRSESRSGQRSESRSGSRSEGRSESRSESRPESRFIEETSPDAASASEAPSVPELEQGGQEDLGPGGKRWRGRRRRGGRGPARAGEAGTSEASPAEDRDSAAEPEGERPAAIHIHETRGSETRGNEPRDRESRGRESRDRESRDREPERSSQAPAFVMPGESLSKYGGAPAPETAKSRPAPPPRSSTSKPSTMIDAPLTWDGSGLLPGESISAHRRDAAPETDAAPEAHAGAWESHSPAADQEELVEEELSTPSGESAPPALHEIASAPRELSGEFLHDPHAADSAGARSGQGPRGEEDFDQEELDEDDLDEEDLDEEEDGEDELDEEELSGNELSGPHSGDEDDASASHRVDPSSPSGFRFLGFGGKKKSEKDGEQEPLQPELPPSRTATAAGTSAASAYAPGQGVIEEELIEGDELDSAPHRRKSVEHDLDDYEEETLPTQIRSGDIGEMLQEAHLDHKIQLTFEEKNGDDDEGYDIDDEEDEEEPAAGAQPAPGQGAAPARDRGGRGRRGGRGQQQGQGGHRRGPSRRSAQTSDLPIISDLLKPGQEILVQIAKEPIAKKGARITSHIALPGRFLVFMPTVTHVGVSRKIASDEERHRLKRILVNERGESTGGFIVRTAAEGASEDELRADLRFLINLWNDIKQRSESSKSPALIYHDLSLIERILRDQVSANFSNIWVDSEADYERIVRFLNRFSPTLVRRVKLYTKETPLFEHFGIQDEISKALRSKVWLKSGGSIVINQTEALVAIDINTGKYVGKSARLEDTILKTNLDAVPEIVRQIRLRDLGGIIVIDFIDMDERKNRFKVMAALEEALKNDRAPTKVLQFNDFGLVAITRKRVKQSLERTLSVSCPTCQATGMVKSPATVCNEIYIELRKMRKHFEGADVMIRVNPETVKILKSSNARWLNDFEDLVGKNILVKSDATLHPEQFDIQG